MANILKGGHWCVAPDGLSDIRARVALYISRFFLVVVNKYIRGYGQKNTIAMQTARAAPYRPSM